MINRHLGNADVVEWQTRYFEGVVSVCSCEFKSHRLHQWKLKTPKSGVFYYIFIHYVSISNRPQRLVKPSYSIQLNTNHIFHYDQALVSASFPFVSI